MAMERLRIPTIAALAAALVVGSHAHPVLAQGDEASGAAGLSPYWKPVVRRWEPIVLHYAERRQMDPDLVASVIWKESRGIETAVGPTGAIGLMCVKPFPWRPSAEALRDPWTNVAAGTGTLAQIIRDGNGDVYYALAAYNGGWDKIHRRVTNRYAADVLQNYVRAVAVKRGFSVDGDWVAILSVEGLHDHRTVTVLGPNGPVARYTERPLAAAVPAVPDGASPHVTVMRFADRQGREARVNLWIVEGEGALEQRSAARQLPAGSLTGRALVGDISAGGFVGLLD